MMVPGPFLWIGATFENTACFASVLPLKSYSLVEGLIQKRIADVKRDNVIHKYNKNKALTLNTAVPVNMDTFSRRVPGEVGIH